MKRRDRLSESIVKDSAALFRAGAVTDAYGEAGEVVMQTIRVLLPMLGENSKLSLRDEAIIRAAFILGAQHTFQQATTCLQ